MQKPKKKTKNITIRSSAAEYLTYVSAIGGQETAVELRYEDENLWLTTKIHGRTVRRGCQNHQ